MIGRSAALVAALTVVAAVLRIPALNSGLWFDEIVMVVEAVRPPLAQLVTDFRPNTHPLYAVLAQASVALFGEHAWSVRLPAVVFGVATIPVFYLMASAVTTRLEAYLAALLLAVSYHHIWFSQNARGYTLVLFAAVLATLVFLHLVRDPQPRWVAAYAVTAALGVYTHMTMALVVLAHACVWMWRIARTEDALQRSPLIRTAVLALAGAAVLSGVLYGPMANGVYAFLSVPRAGVVVATPPSGAVELVRGLRIGFGTIGPLALGAMAGLGAVSYLRRDPMVFALFTLPGAISLGAIVVMGASARPRFFFPLLGFALIVVVRGAAEIARLALRTSSETLLARTGTTLLACVMAAVSLASLPFNYRHPKQDFEGALRYIERHRFPTEPVLAAGLATYPYARFYKPTWIPLGYPAATEWPRPLEALRTYRGRVWIVYSYPEDMDPQLGTLLEGQCGQRQVFPGTLAGGDIVVCTFVGTGDP